MALQQIVCLTAGQRSGTTALRSLMSQTGRLADLGEVFDTAIIDEPQSFFGYCRANNLKFSDVLSGPDAEKLCRGFIGKLRELAPGQHVLIDVKFNSWGEIRMPWTFIHQEPFFLRQLKYREARIVFIWRRDLAGQILSDRLSDAIGKWHNLSAEDAKAPVTLDAAKLAERAKLLCLSESYFFENLKAYEHALLLSYERLFDEKGLLSTEARTKIADAIGEPLAIPEQGLYHRSRIDKRQAIANYDEVAQAIDSAVREHRNPALADKIEI